MISLQEIGAYLDGYLMCASFQDACHNGIQVEGKAEVRRLATAVSCSLATVEAAIEWGADALIVHHGIFWKGRESMLVGPLRKKISLLLEHNISLMAYHLPLDAHQQVGNNWVAARSLGLVDLVPFGEYQGKMIGVMGSTNRFSIDEWVSQVENYYGQPARAALGGPVKLTRVAIISGAADKKLQEAADAGAHCFISGTGDEPNWHTAFESGIHFLAMGHSATERVGPQALAEHLHRHYSIETRFLDLRNPF